MENCCNADDGCYRTYKLIYRVRSLLDIVLMDYHRLIVLMDYHRLIVLMDQDQDGKGLQKITRKMMSITDSFLFIVQTITQVTICMCYPSFR
ncbi:hypothetical protein QQG55_53215 [Brugia pahangi]